MLSLSGSSPEPKGNFLEPRGHRITPGINILHRRFAGELILYIPPFYRCGGCGYGTAISACQQQRRSIATVATRGSKQRAVCDEQKRVITQYVSQKKQAHLSASSDGQATIYDSHVDVHSWGLYPAAERGSSSGGGGS